MEKEKKSTFQDRCDDQAKGIVSQVSPESEQYFEDLAKKLGIKVVSSQEEEKQEAILKERR